MNGAWDNGGEPVEFDYDGAEYRVWGTVSADGDVTVEVKRIDCYDGEEERWGVITPLASTSATARSALEKAWWDQLPWQEQRRLKNQEGV